MRVDRAATELERLHPDWLDIRMDKAFHEWAEQQPQWVQDSLYDNETDAKAAARAIDLYKSDMGLDKKKPGRPKKEDQKDAAKPVGKSKSDDPGTDQEDNVWSESRVKALTKWEYEEHEDAIMEAIKKGTFVYDISGGAR